MTSSDGVYVEFASYDDQKAFRIQMLKDATGELVGPFKVSAVVEALDTAEQWCGRHAKALQVVQCTIIAS